VLRWTELERSGVLVLRCRVFIWTRNQDVLPPNHCKLGRSLKSVLPRRGRRNGDRRSIL
jgi:hypothetical protein